MLTSSDFDSSFSHFIELQLGVIVVPLVNDVCVDERILELVWVLSSVLITAGLDFSEEFSLTCIELFKVLFDEFTLSMRKLKPRVSLTTLLFFKTVTNESSEVHLSRFAYSNVSTSEEGIKVFENSENGAQSELEDCDVNGVDGSVVSSVGC